MTKRDFLILMIKLFGLYSAVATMFSVLPNNILFSLRFIDMFFVVGLIIAALVTVGLFWVLTFKADKRVDLLKLDKGFADDRIELGNIKAIDIVKTGVFIIGGLLILRSIPGRLSQMFWTFKGDIAGQEFTAEDKFNLTVNGLNLLLGYLLFTNYDAVARRLGGKKNAD